MNIWKKKTFDIWIFDYLDWDTKTGIFRKMDFKYPIRKNVLWMDIYEKGPFIEDIYNYIYIMNNIVKTYIIHLNQRSWFSIAMSAIDGKKPWSLK